MIIIFRIQLLVLKHDLMSQDVACSSGPVDRQRVISRYPFCAYVGIYTDGMRASIIRHCGQCQIREGDGLLKEVCGLTITCCNVKAKDSIYTSTGLRKFTFMSTGPAVITKILCVEVNCIMYKCVLMYTIKPQSPPGFFGRQI